MISHLFITFYTTIASALERTSNFVCTFFSEPIFYYSISWGSSCIGEGSRFGPRHPAPNLSNRQMLDMGFSLLSVSHKRKTSSNGPTFPQFQVRVNYGIQADGIYSLGAFHDCYQPPRDSFIRPSSN